MSEDRAVLDVLEKVISRAAAAGGRRWAPTPAGAHAEAFAMATRRVGRAPIEMTSDEVTSLDTAGLPRVAWETDDLARVAVLVRAAAVLDEAGLAALVDDCYRHGDTRERQTVLRALALLPPGDWAVEIGVDACRSSVQPIFEAIACENAFPAWRFPDLNFNQMVLKALFSDVRLARIVGLDGRVSAELTRMAAAYASERRAAGRTVPIDIDRLTGVTQEDLR
jgi:hypothetical protein